MILMHCISQSLQVRKKTGFWTQSGSGWLERRCLLSANLTFLVRHQYSLECPRMVEKRLDVLPDYVESKAISRAMGYKRPSLHITSILFFISDHLGWAITITAFHQRSPRLRNHHIYLNCWDKSWTLIKAIYLYWPSTDMKLHALLLLVLTQQSLLASAQHPAIDPPAQVIKNCEKRSKESVHRVLPQLLANGKWRCMVCAGEICKPIRNAFTCFFWFIFQLTLSFRQRPEDQSGGLLWRFRSGI